MDPVLFQQTLNVFANNILSFPFLIETIIAVVALSPFVDSTLAEIGLSSLTDYSSS
ncbi:hypothetical protein [Corynebacterium deserti]|uniref:hypothetical protein n=1 Tax=Corynebacterium deserti TaxID=1408191 RepID=UPI000A5B0892|nr:hypothetical protein [Corynebacterium deserti]